jgi:protein-S-isoprenylcysteine O-methyltransferase Ste14
LPSRYRVAAGYVAGVLVLALAEPTGRTLAAGFFLALLGEALRVWASGHIEKTQRLATGGPYAHTRNPLYLGTFLMAIGVAIAAATPWAGLSIAAYLTAFYPSVIREEEHFLRRKFGDEYAGWARKVPLVFPRVVPAGPRASRFSWDRVRANREWRTALALPAVLLVLWLRAALE